MADDVSAAAIPMQPGPSDPGSGGTGGFGPGGAGPEGPAPGSAELRLSTIPRLSWIAQPGLVIAREAALSRARVLLAVSFVFAFLVILGASYAGFLFHHPAAMKDWLQAVLPAETGLLGSAVGFYFGSSASRL
jgi:hypothetical protein